jgi:hypothetical protein
MSEPYYHHRTSPKYLEACFLNRKPDIIQTKEHTIVKITKKIQLASYTFHIILSYCTSTTSPKLETSERGLHIYFWNKIINTDSYVSKSPGWLQMCGLWTVRDAATAYLTINPSGQLPHYQAYNSSLKNHRNKWLREVANKNISVSTVSLEVFQAAYTNSNIPAGTKKFCLQQMNHFATIYGSDIYFNLVQDSNTQILAGTCIVDDASTGQSIYQYAFTTKDKSYKHVGVGLIEHCILHAQAKGYSYLSLTSIWDKYQPKSWQGFTQFKLQFKPQIAKTANTYVRIAIKL